MNSTQNTSDSNFWNTCIAEASGNVQSPVELSSANLQSYNRQQDNSNMFYNSVKDDNNINGNSNDFMSQSLNQTLATINQTQNEIDFIKQELNDSDFIKSLDIPYDLELKDFTDEGMKSVMNENNSSSSNTSATSPFSAESRSGFTHQSQSSGTNTADTNNNNDSPPIISLSTAKNGKNEGSLKGSKGEPKVLIDKRKSQNRAAQRAFRERKEQKLKELETKLNESEKEKRKLLEEIEKLKLKNIIITTENQILLNNGNSLDTSSTSQYPTPIKQASGFQSNNTPDIPKCNHDSLNGSNAIYKFQFPKVSDTNKVNLNERINEALVADKALIYTNPLVTNERLLSTQAVWNYLTEFEELNPNYDLDIEEIMNLLYGKEKCLGLGPGYSLNLINEAIQNYFNLHN